MTWLHKLKNARKHVYAGRAECKQLGQGADRTCIAEGAVVHVHSTSPR
jgi:hypothetical protein